MSHWLGWIGFLLVVVGLVSMGFAPTSTQQAANGLLFVGGSIWLVGALLWNTLLSIDRTLKGVPPKPVARPDPASRQTGY